MNRISISQAWAYTTSFFSDQHANHAIALIGVGIFGATVIQLLMGGGAVAMDPATLASGTGAIAALGATAFLAGIIGYVLQTGSYFASWRMGLAPGQETIGSALGYGMIASLPVLLVTIAFILVIGLVLGLLFGTAFIPLLMGRQPSPESMVGTAGLVLVAMPLFLVFFLWIAARFCVMGPIMAAGRSFNPLPALAESWRMTAASQWKLMGYFVLLFIVAMIISMIIGLVFGVSAFIGGGAPDGGSFALFAILGALASIPLAYLYVGIPAGIYKALGGGDRADIFA